MGTKAMSKEQGFITDILPFSVNDGPGIRTTVFFKGCPPRRISQQDARNRTIY